MQQSVLIVKDSVVDKVVDKIINSTSTGLAGEGKIFVSEVSDAIDIGLSNSWRICNLNILYKN